MDHAERSNNKSSQPFYHTQNETTLSSRKNHEATVSHEADSKRPLVLSVNIENKMTTKISGLGRSNLLVDFYLKLADIKVKKLEE